MIGTALPDEHARLLVRSAHVEPLLPQFRLVRSQYHNTFGANELATIETWIRPMAIHPRAKESFREKAIVLDRMNTYQLPRPFVPDPRLFDTV